MPSKVESERVSPTWVPCTCTKDLIFERIAPVLGGSREDSPELQRAEKTTERKELNAHVKQEPADHRIAAGSFLLFFRKNGIMIPWLFEENSRTRDSMYLEALCEET